MTSARHLVPAVVAAGLGVAAGLAALTGASASDAALVISLAVLGSVVAALAGSLVLRRLRRRRLGVQVVVIVGVATATTAAGVLAAAKAMFISGHDVGVLAVVLVVSAAVSIGTALRLGSSFERSAAHVAMLARDLASPGLDESGDRPPGTGAGLARDAPPASAPLVTGELHDLAAQLAEASRQLARSRQRERALDLSRRELIAWVSHDLRSPIASIRAMAEALEDGVVDDASSVSRFHAAIRQESERLGALVDDLFELSRITAGAIDVDQPLLPLAELVADVVSGAELVAATKGVSVVSLLDDVAPALVPASDLRRILRNLLDNAVRHTRPGGTVVVGGEVNAQVLRLDVSDECGGIPETDLTRIFDVAFRGDTARTRDQGGGGLGLAIAKGLLEAHRGSIQIANHAPGCRFTVRIPVMQP